MERITRVTERCYQFGIIDDCQVCPIALALIYNGYDSVEVHNQSIDYLIYAIPTERKSTSKKITKELQKRIASIDAKTSKLKPFKIIEKNNSFSIYRG